MDKYIFSKWNVFHCPSIQKERKKIHFWMLHLSYAISSHLLLFYFFSQKGNNWNYLKSLLFRSRNEILSSSCGINKQHMYWFSISLWSCSVLCRLLGSVFEKREQWRCSINCITQPSIKTSITRLIDGVKWCDSFSPSSGKTLEVTVCEN